MRIGIGLGLGGVREGDLAGSISEFVRAEQAGFDAAWVTHIFGFDALMLLAMAGRETSRIELGTFVVPTYPRHPVALAQQALTAAAASGGRLTLGIGLSHRVVIENMYGLDFSKPARHMREYLSVLGPLLDGKPAAFQGDEYRVMARLSVPGASRPGLLVAGLGPRMLKLAGGMADGTATWMGGPAYLRDTAIPAVRAAAAAAGRGAPRIAAGLPIVATSRADDAREAAAKVFATYGTLPSYRAVLDQEGASGPADVAIIGTEAEVEARLRELSASGVTDFNAALFPVEGDPGAVDRTYELLAQLAGAGM